MIAAIAGLLSAICATTVMLGNVIFPAGLDGGKSFSMEEAWIAGVGGLLIVLIIVSFGRQMARENRTHLIRSLSHSVVEGVAMIASAGWCFLPVLLPTTHSRAAAMSAASGATVDMFSNVTTTWVVAAIVTVLVAVALTVCSYFWHRDADPEPDARSPWIGLALLPVMLTGLGSRSGGARHRRAVNGCSNDKARNRNDYGLLLCWIGSQPRNPRCSNSTFTPIRISTMPPAICAASATASRTRGRYTGRPRRTGRW